MFARENWNKIIEGDFTMPRWGLKDSEGIITYSTPNFSDMMI